MGVSVNDTNSEIKMAMARVTANSKNKRPTTSAINSSGINTAIKEKVREIRVKPISLAPCSAACNGDLPCSRWRAMFSSITMASSTTKPVAIVKAINVKLLIEKSNNTITAKVPTSDSGTAKDGIMVAGTVRKNTKVTAITKPMANISSCCTSRTDERILCVRSVNTVTSKAAGKDAVNCGKISRTLSATSMTLAPGWR